MQITWRVFQLATGDHIINIASMFFVNCVRFLILLVLALTCSAYSQEAQRVDPEQKNNGEKAFALNMVVHPRVAGIGPPVMRPTMVGTLATIASPSDKAREHVRNGFALVHAQWDFEAYRHFCAALAADPDCLMAYCGVSLALIQPFNEYSDFRRAAVTRMLDLVDADDLAMKNGKAGRYPKLEKKFAVAIAALVATNPRTAGAMFHEIADKHPQLVQARLIGLFLTRGGYDVADEPSSGQRLAIEKTHELLEQKPDNPMVTGFWLLLNAEAPSAAMDFKKQVLPHARRLVEKCPDVPTWQHALGHYEWRVGNYALAERAFTKAVNLYEEWMEANGVDYNDCDGYIKSKCYLANTLYQRGDFEAAMAVAKELRALKPDVNRPRSSGSQIILWRGFTLPSRLYMARGQEGDLDLALELLPSKEELEPFVAHPEFPSLCGVYVEALGSYIGSRKAIAEKEVAGAAAIRNENMREQIMKMAAVVDGAMRASGFTHYFNAGSSLAIYDMELAGLIAMYGDEVTRSAASSWFMSARDKQGVPSLMMSPMVLAPMENRLAEYYLSAGKAADAYEAFQGGLQRYPNNMASLRGLKRCLNALGENEQAELVEKHIELLESGEPVPSEDN